MKQESQVKIIKLGNGAAYMPIIGPPVSSNLKSGYMKLPPGTCVGQHSTKEREELIVVLEGEGRVIIPYEGTFLEIQQNTAVYIPPQTEHNVVNTGKKYLRYVYVTAETIK